MGYISGFGIRFAAPILALGILAQGGAKAEIKGAELTVNISGMRNADGQVLICLTQNPKAFPDCKKDAGATTKTMPAADAETVKFDDVKPGTYAISIVHDENSNKKMDMRIFIPREGFAFSRNPKIGMGPPKFKSAAFDIGNGAATQNVRMKYIF